MKTNTKGLGIFKVKNESVANIFKHLETLYKYYATNVTKIHDRFDLHLAIDLAYHSPLKFKFQGKEVKGWLDILIMGDEATGKTCTAKSLKEYFKLGEMVSAQDSSFASLVSGVSLVDGHPIVVKGNFPLNDKGLLIVDEAGDLDQAIWDNLAYMRSSGIIDLVKLIDGKMNARTRVIWLSNAKGMTKIKDKNYGITCLPELATKPADIRRFDLVVILSGNDVSSQTINSEQNKLVRLINPQLDHNLIKWAWSREIEDICFTPGAVKTAVELTVKLGKEYSSTIPLILGQDVRFKIARLAVSLAIRLFSHTKGNMNKVLVKKVHVDCVERIFDVVYGKKSNGYKDFSKFERQGKNIKGTYFSSIKQLFKMYANPLSIMDYFMRTNTITVKDFSVFTGYSMSQSERHIGDFCRLHCLKNSSYSGTYYKTPSFVKFLKNELLVN
jgi:hypothetical protein